MKKFLILFLFVLILPVVAYEIYSPKDYQYNDYGDNLLFILDFSNSMSEHIEHQSKTNQLKSALRNILTNISPETKVGVRVYGHNRNLLAMSACRSSELLVPLAKNNNALINSKIAKLHPKGMTPITYSLKQAVKKDFEGLKGLKHIILLTDGGENCDESPCEYSIKLIKQRKDIKIDVIAFHVDDENDLDQLRCTADVTGGHFIEANTNAQLIDSLQELTTPHKEVEAVLYGSN